MQKLIGYVMINRFVLIDIDFCRSVNICRNFFYFFFIGIEFDWLMVYGYVKWEGWE